MLKVKADNGRKVASLTWEIPDSKFVIRTVALEDKKMGMLYYSEY